MHAPDKAMIPWRVGCMVPVNGELAFGPDLRFRTSSFATPIILKHPGPDVAEAWFVVSANISATALNNFAEVGMWLHLITGSNASIRPFG